MAKAVKTKVETRRLETWEIRDISNVEDLQSALDDLPIAATYLGALDDGTLRFYLVESRTVEATVL